jgi:hypothetical protein
MQLSKEEVASKIIEIPATIEKLKAEYNQLLGYNQALNEMEEAKKSKDIKKNDAKANN